MKILNAPENQPDKNEKPELSVSVRRLVEFTLRSGDLDLTHFGSGSPREAIRIHKDIQQSRPKVYNSEVPVSTRIERDRFIIRINGRIDGLYTYPDRIIIDEIKTTQKNISDLEENEDKCHWGQLKCYAYIYALENDLSKIEGQLTYYHIHNKERREIRRIFNFQYLTQFVNDLIEQYLVWAGMVHDWIKIRDDSIVRLDFPFENTRPGQQEIIDIVQNSIHENNHLLLQAPTGMGKTVAVLYPSVKALSHGSASKIFYLTARTTGRAAAEDSLDLLRNHGLRMKSISLTAKEKSCLRPDSLCNGAECPFARGFYDRVNEALLDAFVHDSFTYDTVIELSKRHCVCPFEFSLELSEWVECIICDYNYVFDPRVYLKRFFQSHDDYLFLVDEAHNLVDRARAMFSAAFHKEKILELRRHLKGKLPKITLILNQLNRCLLNVRKRCELETTSFSEKTLPADFCRLLIKFSFLAERWLSLNQPSSFRQTLINLYFEARAFLQIAERFDESYAVCYTKMDKNVCVKLFCIDPSTHLIEHIERSSAAIFFSATLSPKTFFSESFGLGDDVRELILPSPFERRNLRVLIARRISTLYIHREITRFEVVNAIFSFIHQKKGNYIIFFPSYAYMNMIYTIVHQVVSDVDLILQSPRMSEQARKMFIDQFQLENDRSTAGFAVLGGVFGESIDLLGERLTGAAIVGVGLPGISLERELIKAYFNDRNGSGFAFAYQFPGFIKVLQAAGRVIRSDQDRGTVLLVDSRFGNFRYRSAFPCEWDPIYVENAHEIRKMLGSFWNR